MGYRTNIFSIDKNKVKEFKDNLDLDTDIYEYLKNEYELGDYNVDKDLSSKKIKKN